VPDMQEHGVGQIWEWYMRVYRYMISGWYRTRKINIHVYMYNVSNTQSDTVADQEISMGEGGI
jgi:hypothetical protein